MALTESQLSGRQRRTTKRDCRKMEEQIGDGNAQMSSDNLKKQAASSLKLSDMLKNAAALIPTWFETWGLQPITAVDIAVNNRLRRTRGRAALREGRIEVRPDLLSGSRQTLLETLCHEAAHIAVFRTHANARPHGPEWRQMVIAAGFEPRVQRIAECRLKRTNAVSELADRSALEWAVRIYDHRCPVCQMVRTAKRPVPRWRCAECIASGLAGELLISPRTRLQRRSD
jgi:predicted SprT family Zn-dependent metalloprotease